MTREIKETEGNSYYIGELPEGCKLCIKGAKMVLFVTGICSERCFYCPLSEERKNKDVIFADEMPVESEEDIIYESKMISAEGASITGGDPLERIERTIKYIRLLKETFGKNFHIHLYTTGRKLTRKIIKDLESAGLDEIRFHIRSGTWHAIELALQTKMDVGIEIPVLPGTLEYLQRIAIRAELRGVKFLNLNELEYSETNFENMVKRGYLMKDDISAAIKESNETAMEFLKWASKRLKKLNVHYCTSKLKDGTQLRNRLKRRAKNIAKEYEQITDEGLLILGIIKIIGILNINDLINQIKNEFGIPNELFVFNEKRNRIETTPKIIENLGNEIKQILEQHNIDFEIGIAEEYPTWDRLQTQFIPLDALSLNGES